MKLRYLFSMMVASVLLFAGCVKEEATDSFANIQLDRTYLSIPEAGGNVELRVNATEAWAIETEIPEWLTIDKIEGAAGETVVNVSAEAVSGGREVELCIKAGVNKQFFRVRQGSLEAVSASCADVIAGPDGKTYRVKGTVTSIVNTTYGNWYLNDGTGEVYVYGTLDKDGKTKNFTSLGMEVGDVVEIEGPKLTYGSTVELVDVTVLKISKAFAKVVTPSAAYPKEGAEFDVKVAYKGEGIFPSVPEEFRSWVSILDVQNKPGEATKIEPNPADTAIVKIAVLPNDGGARNGSVNFTSASSTVPYEFSQEGSIAEVSVADFLAQPVGTALYKLTGKVSGLKPGDYGNFHLVDATGSVYVYGLTATPVEKNDKSFPSLGIREGDVVTLIGTRAQYAGAKVESEKEQVGGPAYYVSHIGHTESTVADFLAQPVAADKWYKLTGKVTNLKAGNYGNFDLVDETGSVYVYGLTVAPVAKNDQSFPTLGINEGDIVTLIGTRADYKGTSQVGGPAYYISHVEGAPAADPWEAEGVATYVLDEFMYTDYPQYCALTELKAYADETNVYARLKTTKTSGVGMLRLCTADTGEGSESVWYWEKTTYATPVYKSSKAKVDENFNFELSYNGAAVGLETKIEGEDVYWIMTIPRSAHDHAKNAGTMHLGFVSYTAAEAENGFMPKVWGEMLKVTLP